MIDKQKHTHIIIRLSHEEKALLKERAETEKLNMSSYVRHCLLRENDVKFYINK